MANRVRRSLIRDSKRKKKRPEAPTVVVQLDVVV